MSVFERAVAIKGINKCLRIFLPLIASMSLSKAPFH